MDFHLLLLRLAHASPGAWMLSRVFLLLALSLLVQQLWLRRSPTLAEMNVVTLRGGLLVLPLVLGAAALCAWFGYQNQGQRTEQLRLARSAPVRLAYGSAGAPTIQVFTAPGCGPCRNLEVRLRTFIRQGYAVEYIPVSMNGDEDWEELEAALCSADPRAGFEQVFALAGAPPATPGCISPVRGNEPVLQALSGRQVFPTVVMPDGLLRVGAPSDGELRDYLQAVAPLPAAGKAL